MIKTHIIALTGYAGAGKDTVADLLVTHCGFRKLAFADALRAEVAEAFGIDVADLTHRSTKDVPMGALCLSNAPHGLVGSLLREIGPGGPGAPFDLQAFLAAPRSPRQILQWWGTEYRRAQAPDYWTHIVSKRIRWHMLQHERRFVITDCRFDNEAECVRAMGGQVWQVQRVGVDGASTPEGAHSSATDGSRFNPEIILRNGGSIRDLQEIVLGAFWAHDAGLRAVRVEVLA